MSGIDSSTSRTTDAQIVSAASSAGLGRDTYREITLYAPDRAPVPVDLSDNTNLWGVPPAAAAAIRDAAGAAVTRYPSLYAQELKSALARYIGVEPETIVTGCGSDDVLDSAMRAFAEPGDRVVSPDPSFMMIPLFARMNALEPILVPLTAGLDIDAEAMVAAGGRITYVCSPNNPTGTLASRRATQQVLDGARGLVIVDEAYAEFGGKSLASEAPARENLLVVRTMSKAFGLAGLRVGYAIGNPRLVAEVEKSRGPYKVSSMAERAAVTALTQDMPWVRSRIAEVLENRARLSTDLASLNVFDIVSSAANFIFARVPASCPLDAAELGRRLRTRGIAIRPFSALTGMGDGIRITIGPWNMMQRFLETLQEVLAEAGVR